ncbi:LAGLIDADG family homing endonuclease [Kitasatospora sp. NPDC057223]|uniref:LAGLIDADG family homing endonuclease n=1 Tax=Kitasatospora sp. NPDC057223 TaxID=3346055 RepID=UPI00362825ED
MTFLDLENPGHAYLFGFLQADGHLSQGIGRKGRLTVELSARDAPILEAFQRLCPYNSGITYRTRATNFATEHTSVQWTVCALEFREELKALGFPVGRKSLTVAPPKVPFVERDYLRGLIDADGSVGRTAQDLPFVSFTTQSDALAAFSSRYFGELTDTRRVFRRNNRDAIYNIVFSREEAVAIALDLYYPGCLALPRKQASADHAAAWVRPPGVKKVLRRSWSTEEDETLLAAGSAADAAGQLGRTVQSCSLRRWRLIGPKRPRAKSLG